MSELFPYHGTPLLAFGVSIVVAMGLAEYLWRNRHL